MANNLKHVGVLGMHWGHRKAKQRITTIRGKTAIVTGNRFRSTTINKNPTKEEINKIRRPISTKTRELAKRYVESKFAQSLKEAVFGTAKNAAVAASAFVAVYGTMTVIQMVGDAIT